MRPVLSLFLLSLLLPSLATAQRYSDAPMLVVGDAADTKNKPVPASGFPNFPENAITRVGENTTGLHVDAPANPASPTAPANPAAAPAPASPAPPTTPPAPKSPVSTLWPRDTIPIFLPSCMGFYPQFLAPCTCVITRLMAEMPHDEFLEKSEKGTIEQDPRLIRIRTDCVTAPQRKEAKE